MVQLAPGFEEGNPGPKLAPGFTDVQPQYSDPYSSTSDNLRLEQGRLVTTSDVEDYMASNQSAWELWGKGLAQGLSEAVLGTVEGASYLFDLDQHWKTLTGAEREFGNSVSDAMRKAKEDIEQATHVYKTKDAREDFAPWDATWWASNAPTLGTSLSLLIPAGFVGKGTATVGKAIGIAARGAEFGQGLRGATLLNTVEGVSSAVASRLMESTMEAKDVYDRVYDEMLPTLGEEMAKETAGQAASKTYKGNWLFLAQDMFQYMSLLKGFKSAATGSKGFSMGELGKQILSEAGEEAGQFVLAEESYQDAVNPTVDFFGKGLGDRLADYVRDPEFKTSAFFGGLGGGIFTAAAPLARKAVSGVEKLADMAKNFYRPSPERQAAESMIVEEANYRGDKATSQKMRDIIFARQATNAIKSGNVQELSKELESLANDKNTPEGARKDIKEKIEQLDWMAKEQANLKSSGIPEDLHEDVLLTKLDHLQSAKILSETEANTERIYSDLQRNRALDTSLVPLKRLQVAYNAWKYINKATQKYANDLARVEKAYNDLYEQTKASTKNLDVGLTTPSDKELVSDAIRMASLGTRLDKLKSDLQKTTTPEGIQKLRDALSQEAANRRAQSVLDNPDATREEILRAATETNDPDLTRQLHDIINQRNLRDKEDNKEKTKAKVEASKWEKFAENPPTKQLTEEPTTTSIESSPKIGPPEQSTGTQLPGELPSEQTPGETLPDESVPPPENEPVSPNLTQLVIDRLEGEEPNSSTPQNSLDEKTDMEKEKPVSNTHQSNAHSWLKEVAGSWKEGKFEPEVDANGIPIVQEYTNNDTGEAVPITEVFATDNNGILLVNTPVIGVGTRVVLRVDDDFKYTVTPGFKPTGDHNRFINIYRADKSGKAYGKPIAQLASADGPTATDGDRQLREEVLKTGRVLTTITDKNLGDFLRSSFMNDIRVLESDYHIDENGDWKLGITPYKPILGFVGTQGTVNFPNMELMQGTNPRVIDEVMKLDKVERPKSIYAGTVVVARTNPKGGYRVAQLHPRKLNSNEIDWLRQNIAEFVRDGRISELREIINIVPKDISDIPTMNTFPKDKIYYIGEDILFHANNGWIKINARGKFGFNFDNFMKVKSFNFQAYDDKGIKRDALFGPDNTTPEDYNTIRLAFDNILTNSFKNINKIFINSEQPYSSPLDPDTMYDSYYEYLHKTTSLQTDLPGSMNGPGEGLTAGYSFYNTTTYFNPLPQREDIVINEDKIEELPPEKPQIEEQSTKEQNKKTWQDLADDIEESGFDGLYRRATPATGFEVISEKELDWFRDRFGSDFLTVVKGVDRILSIGGVEAFGWYHNAMVTLAELGEIGTAYHEAFHFAFNTQLSDRQKRSIFKSAVKIYGEPILQPSVKHEFKSRVIDSSRAKIPISEIFKRPAAHIPINVLGRLSNGYEEVVDITSIIPSPNQGSISGEYISPGENYLPTAIKYNGKYYLEDGHHRVGIQILDGEHTVKLKVRHVKGVDFDSLGLEERLAEDFRAYMLSDGKTLPKVKEAKGFFSKILTWIKNLLGMRSPIERLFGDIATTRLTNRQKIKLQLRRSLSSLTKNNDLRHRLLPGFRVYAQQGDSIMATAHRVMEHAREAGVILGQDEDQVLSNKGNIDKIFDTIYQEYSDLLRELVSLPQSDQSRTTVAQIMTIAATGAVPEDLREQVDKYLGQWEDVGEGNNIKTGFKTEVLRALSRFGFTVNIKGTITDLNETGDLEEEEIENEMEEDEGERHIYGLDFVLRSPRKLLSTNIRRFLSTVQEYQLNTDGSIATDTKNKPVIRKTLFGTPKYIDFNRAYANLSVKLADASDPYSKLEELSKSSPVLLAIYDRLTDELSRGNTKLFAEFQVKFNLSQYQYMTVRMGKDSGEDIADVIFTDRKSVERVIKQNWRENSIRLALIDSQGQVNKPKAQSLQKRFNSFEELYRKRKADKNRLTFKELREISSGILSDIGVDISDQVWKNIKNTDEPSSVLERMLFGKQAATLEQFLFLATDKGIDPYSERTVVDVLARYAKDTVEDLHAGTFLNEKNNQVNSVNLNSYITEKIRELTDPTTSDDAIAFLQQDNFYKAGKYENQFLRYLKTQEGKSKTRMVVLSALKENKQAKEFEDLTSTDSTLARLVSFYNGGTSSGFIYLGTLSDKQKQLMQLLPKSRGANARNFLYQTLRGTVSQEIARIQRINRYLSLSPQEQADLHKQGVLPTDISAYGKANRFMYIPSLNDIQGLADSLSDGTMNPDNLGDIEKSIQKSINDFIEEQKSMFYSSLVKNGIVEWDKGRYSNLLIPEAIVAVGSNVSGFIDDFFYNDFAWRTDISKVIHGDLAFYKDQESYFKRGYQVITPGLRPYINPKMEGTMHRSKLRRAVFSEVFKNNDPSYLLTLAQLIEPSTTAKNIANNDTLAAQVVNNYSEINKTDAQSLTTVAMWREIAKGFSQWTDDHERVYQFAWVNNWSINEAIGRRGATKEEASAIKRAAARILLQPLKPFQFGERAITLPDGEVMIVKEQFKDSITPLIPDWTNRHPHYKQLLQFMEENKVDIASAADTVKVGNYGATQLTGKIEPWRIRELPVSSLRFPQSIPPVDKEEIRAGTQFWKLLFANMTNDWYNLNGVKIRGNDLFKRGQELWANRIEKSAQKLADKLGLGVDMKLSENNTERGKQLFLLKTLLEQELASRELHDNYLDAIQLIVDDMNRPDFNLSLDFPALGSKFLQVLTNIFKKNIITQKVPGLSKINLADYGTSIEHSEELNFITNKDGNVVEAEVGMSVPFLNKLGIPPTAYNLTTGKLDWDRPADKGGLTADQKKSLQMIMYRIPTSGKNSILPIRVVRVFPSTAGSILMVPGEGTKQAGFDFDVDKSFIMTRVLKSDTNKAELEQENLDNEIFDVAWAILTDPKHIREMITPIDAVVHDRMIAELSQIKDPLGPGNIIETATKASPFSIVSDLSAEEIGKHSKRQVGIFSRYSTGHAILQHISKLVDISVPIEIELEEGEPYRFNKAGNSFDNEGEYISNNHSALQNSALDAQKDPKLGKLNITTLNAAIAAYMTDLGVSMPIVVRFMNQPILRELTRYYYQTGGTDIEAGVDKLLTVYPGVKTLLDKAKKSRIERITDKNLRDSLSKPIQENTQHQAQVLADFLSYQDAAQDMNTVNNVLSVDTIRDMTGIEALESFKNQVLQISDDRSSVVIPQYVFNDIKRSPIPRVAAFYKYGIEGAFNFIEQFYPYTSSTYNISKDYLAVATGRKVLRSKEIIAAANKFIDYFSLVYDGTLDSIISRYSSGHNSRWSYFQYDKSIKDRVQKLMELIPKLKDNPFIQGLRFDTYSGKGVQMFGVTNTNANYNKTRMTQGWWDMMIDKDERIRTLAFDLVRFAIKTSGFQYSTSSFYDLIPVQFWNMSGLAEYQKTLSKGLRDGSVRFDALSTVRSFIRHNFRMKGLIPTVFYSSDSVGGLGNVTVKDKSHLVSFKRVTGKDIEPSYLKYYDRENKTWRLYEASASDSTFYNEIQPLGEPGAFYEVSPDPENRSIHPDNTNHGKSTIVGSTPSLLDDEEFDEFMRRNMEEEDVILKKYNTFGNNSHVADALPAIIENETNPQIREVAKKLSERAYKFNVPIENTDWSHDPLKLLFYKGELARTGDGMVIKMNRTIARMENSYRKTLLHEILHAASIRILEDPETERERKFVETVSKLRKEAETRLGTETIDISDKVRKVYGLTNNKEFIAELGSNPSFVKQLRTKNVSLFDRIIRAFRRLLGLTDVYDNVLKELYSVVDEAADDLSKIRKGASDALRRTDINLETVKIPNILHKIMSSLEHRLTRLQRLDKSSDAIDLNRVLGDMDNMARDEAVLKYVDVAHVELEDVRKSLIRLTNRPEARNPDLLRILQEQLNSYSLLYEVKNYIRRNPDHSPQLGSNAAGIVGMIDSLLANVSTMKDDLRSMILDRVASVVKDNIGESLTLDEIKEQLDVADRDVALINRFLSTPADSRDIFIKAITKMIKDGDAAANRKSVATLYATDSSEETVSYLGKRFTFTRRGYAEVNNDYEKWLKSKGISIGNVAEKNKSIINQKSISGETFEKGIEFISPFSVEGKRILSTPKNSEDYPLRQYYENVVLGYLKSQETIHPEWMRPGIRIPSLQRGILEAISVEKGKDKLRVIHEQALEEIRRRYDETDFRAVDEAGRPVDFVPIRFTSQQTGEDGRLSRREVSLDVATTVFLFITEMNRHDEMMKIVSDVELVKESLGERKVAQTRRKPGFWGLITPDRKYLVGEDGIVLTKSGRQSNAYLNAEQIIRRLLYGQLKKDEGSISLFGTKVDIAKATDLLTKYTGFAKLSLNMGIAATNLGVGEITAVKEAIGGNIFNWSDWRYGKKKFAQVIPQLLGDLGKRSKQTKISRVYSYFDPTDRGKYEHGRLGVDTTRARAILKPDILSSPNKISELELSMSLMFTIMNQYKVIDPITGKKVPLYEGIEPRGDGSIGLASGFKMEKGDFTSELIDEVRQKILRTYQKMNGIYNLIDSPGIRETAIGRLVIFMRSWLMPGIEARWRLRNYDDRLKDYDEGHYISAIIFFTNAFHPDNGFVSSIAKSMRFLIGSTDSNDLLTPSEIEDMSDEQKQQLIALRKANIRKTIFELYMIAGISALMMLAWDDDDRDSYTLMMLARMRRELMTFFSPNTAWDVLRSPSVALDTIEGLSKLTYYSSVGMLTGEAYKLYEAGPRKGESRIESTIKDRVPVLSQRHQFDDLEKKIQLIERGWR